ncbi:carbon starvation CstA family protein [Thermosphaera aggregans]|uniref:Carbon starvation protein CstA n=1 Tax=Thermosphaera aggregans (strain DSM 11486 / M11TL) TaxID=633148 RepID=D5U1R2_THEAM|nr:carbon starvation protein A [Thermosphaera aggregans]ADG91062.1 carbon starvation protein CstA [Thermosphaera aggregans DSM 11486]
MYPILILLIVLFIYGIAYVFYGRKILEQRVTKADPNRPTPALTKFDGVDYVPANKYVLYGHHFASIAGAGPITGPAFALNWGWGLPLIWVLFGNVFIGAVHDYLAIMSSIRHGGLSVMSISESTMGKKARYVFLAYTWFALILVLAAFLSVASSTFINVPSAATVAVLYMPLALLFGIMVYRLGVNVKVATAIALVLEVVLVYASYYTQLVMPGDAPVPYQTWVVMLAVYSFIAASLPVWFLLQPRDYLNAYLLWGFVALAVLAPLAIPLIGLTGPLITSFVASGATIGAIGEAAKADIAWFWPTVPLTIACGALSGFHSVVGSGTTSKQLANELDALLVGYGGMLTEGAVSSLAVILPAAIVWDFSAFASNAGLSTSTLLNAGLNVTATPTVLKLSGVSRFYTSYGLVQALMWSRLLGVESFPALYKGFSTFAAWALAAFVLTTLDTANRLARFAWVEMFDWVKARSPGIHKVIANRWVASLIPILIGAVMALPQVTDPLTGKPIYAYQLIWPAFSGTNQLLAAIALLTEALWVYAVLKVRGKISLLIMVPAVFLWVTVTSALFIWLFLVVPTLPTLYIATTGLIVVASLVLDIALVLLFVKSLRHAARA